MRLLVLTAVLALGARGATALAADAPQPSSTGTPPPAASASAPRAPSASPAAEAGGAAVPRSPPVSSASSASRPLIHEAAPRPEAAVRVQQRFAVKAKQVQVFGGVEYLSRGDFYNSPGVRVGGAYYLLEPLALEAQISHYWSSLDGTAAEVLKVNGSIPDSHPPGWLALAGARYSIGYGKLVVGGLGGVIHFEPQAFVHGGIHDNSGDVGPSADFGLGFLVFLLPRLFMRADVSVTLDWESRLGRTVTDFGTAPALTVGGML